MRGICQCINGCITNEPPSPSADQSTSILSNIRQCHALSQQTITLCHSTLTTSQDLVQCGQEIQQSLIGAATDLDAQSFAVIADLIDGDKTNEARKLADRMKDQSSQCLSLSLDMVSSLDKCVSSLPEFVENYIETKAQEAALGDLSADEREILSNVDGDLQELTNCMEAMEDLKLVTTVEAGVNAFRGIASKSRVCHRIFQMIETFSSSLAALTKDFIDLDASAILSKRKEIFRAIGLGSIMKQFAEACQRLVNKILECFRGAAGKLSELWKALSRAKDVMVQCLTEVCNAQSLCEDAKEKLEQLKALIEILSKKFWKVRSLTPESVSLVKSMHSDRGLNDAVGTARDLDDGIEEALSKMKSAAAMVGNEFDKLPSMITDGISSDVNNKDIDRAPVQ